jgi:adenosylcobinamide kinase / adenosylcobinamide-phosphate guanylyltransferase
MGLTLVLGGVRSGKSRLAEELAARLPPVVYVATAQAGDAEMARRIARHQQQRAQHSPPWRTVEEPWDVVSVVASPGGSAQAPGCILVECLTLWVTNLLLGLPGRAGAGAPLTESEIMTRVRGLAEVARTQPGQVIVVSNEVGCGIMPANALARRFGDVLGEANQVVAAAAAEVYVCWAGIPWRIK